ncbi:putative ABC transporter [Afipia carboxidovorans OM5]|uniref:Putative ABC transporter substrate-binding protein n=1 Tax=Afipia carboxidovorans (strain ATCC 49405 / DSM 1227 / KCTC 32145 / OM5) TaxID=504832 RepID=B6JE48_AFIC5|nr:ABC-type transport auxiliary lipoprotein family protein [Afipia carboxidovorans]ACI93941.1 putative ABC transporter [Afipia carboxidovorans OM5]AEI02385.1 putative ABC transporter substrate-binding protein [Afipia carboxidovorans OM4]AEI05961.1 putative ABC transporter substrate-binding protein [Afipia carboxidovorans OM5]
METRAPYIIVGLFVLSIAAAVFGFVYWLNNAGGLGARSIYQVQFDEPVPGLLVGAGVLFNGIRVGEVTRLALDPQSPRRVNASVSVLTDTPVRADTKVGLEFQGLTGVPVIALEGNKDTLATTPIGVLVASPGAGQSMTQAAREALRKIDSVLSDNSQPLHDTIANLSTFAEGLARNTGRLDGILAGLERMTGGGEPQAQKHVYDLSAVQTYAATRTPLTLQLAIPEPTVILALDTQRLIVTPEGDALDASIAQAQWADSIPKLVQARLLESFENYSEEKAPVRPTDGVQTDATLLSEIRRFGVDTSGSPTAEISLSVKLVAKSGQIVASRIFRSNQPVAHLDAKTAVSAIDRAFTDTAKQIVTWAADKLK